MPELQKYCENRAMSGYGSALLYKESNEELYHLLLPLESAPTVSGSVDTFDFDILTCPSKGQVEGKESLDQKDVDFLWHRDNVRRLEALQGQILDFMVVYQDFTARTFTGSIKVRPQDSSADIMRGTFTITPMSASTTTILDARDLIQDTVVFTNKIPASVVMKGTTHTVPVKTDPTTATFEVTSDNSNFSGKVESGVLTITYKAPSEGDTVGKKYAVISIKANALNYASWTTSISVEHNVTEV